MYKRQGTSWTELGDLSTGRAAGASLGTSSSALYAGGTPPNTAITEEWSAPATFRQINLGDIYYNADPSSGVIKYTGYGTGAWSSGGSLNTAKIQHGGAGTQTAGLAFAGAVPDVSALAEEYNGSSWTESGDLNTARRGLTNAGTQTAALAITGYTTANVDVVESYNGSSWTETHDVNTARRNLAGGGTSTSAIFAGGYSTAYVGISESYNGSAWSEVADLSTVRALSLIHI